MELAGLGRADRRAGVQGLRALLHPQGVRPSANVSNPALLVALARQHRLSAQLEVADRRCPFLSPETRTGLVRRLRVESALMAASRRELIELVGALKAAGIRPVVLKGQVVADILHGGLPRLAADHDVLFRPTEVDAAAPVLTMLGYHQEATHLYSAEDYRRFHHHDAPWIRQGASLPVEVHRHALAPPLDEELPIEILLARTCAFTLDLVEVERFGDRDLLIHLAVHATEETLPDTLRPHWEVAVAATRLEPDDWDDVLRIVPPGQLARRLWCGLAAANANFPGTVPHWVLVHLARAGSVKALRKLVVPKLARTMVVEPRFPWVISLAATAFLGTGSDPSAAWAAVRSIWAAERTHANSRSPGSGVRAVVVRWVGQVRLRTKGARSKGEG